MAEDFDVDEFRDLLRRIAATPPGEPAAITDPPRYEEPVMQAPAFKNEFNTGHLMQAAALLITIGGLVWYLSARISVTESNIATLTAAITKYAPQIETSSKINEVQDERIQNLTTALGDLRRAGQESGTDSRRATSEIMTALGTLREDMAQVKAKLSIERR